MDRLKDQVLIVTGGAHGIGRAYCEGLAKEGARVVVADIDGPGAEAVVQALGENGNDALAIATDVSGKRTPTAWPPRLWQGSVASTD